MDGQELAKQTLDQIPQAPANHKTAKPTIEIQPGVGSVKCTISTPGFIFEKPLDSNLAS